MPAPFKVFRVWQAGIETTRGTAVAADRLLYAEEGELTKNQPQLSYPEDRGGFVRDFEANLALVEAGGSIPAEKVTFETLPWWLALALKGGVASVEDPGASGRYKWDHVPSVSTDDLKAATFEWKDGANEWEMPFGMVNRLVLTGAYGDVWKLNAELIGKDKIATTLTPALAAISRNWALFTKTQVFVDATTIGTTEVLVRLLEAEIGINNNITREYFGNSALMQDINRGLRQITARLRLKFSDKTYYDNWLAETTQKVRLKITGPNIGANPRLIQIDLYGRWQSHVLGLQDGMVYADMELLPIYDPTVTAEIQITVWNNRATL